MVFLEKRGNKNTALYSSIIIELFRTVSIRIMFSFYLVLAHKFIQSVMGFVSCLLHGPEVRVIPFGYFDEILGSKK